MTILDFAGFILPPIIDYINRYVESKKLRFVISVLISILVAVIYKFDSITYGSPEEVLATATLIFTQSQVVYNLVYKKSDIQLKIRSGA